MLVDTSQLDYLISQMRTVAANDLILPTDHNFQNDMIKKIRSILAGIAVGGVAEGNYSAYDTKHTIQVLLETADIRIEQSWLLDESKFLYLTTNGNLQILDVDLGIIIDTGEKGSYGGDSFYTSKSIFGKYFVIVDYVNALWMKVYKDGIFLQTINVDDPAKDMFSYPSISYSGKYIVVSYYAGGEPSALRYKIKVYEGS